MSKVDSNFPKIKLSDSQNDTVTKFIKASKQLKEANEKIMKYGTPATLKLLEDDYTNDPDQLRQDYEKLVEDYDLLNERYQFLKNKALVWYDSDEPDDLYWRIEFTALKRPIGFDFDVDLELWLFGSV